MPVVHLVLIQVKPDADPVAVLDACSRITRLKDRCLHPDTQKPYMRYSVGGRDSSPEGLQHGITHVFVEEFESEEDRKYYLERDPGHKEFVKGLGGLIEKVQIIDFSPGVF